MILQNDVRATAAFRARRDHLLRHRTDLAAARRLPAAVERLTHFNWAFDWFDDVAARNDAIALIVVGESSKTSLSYAQLARESSRWAAWLQDIGVRAGDRVMLVLGNCPELWQIILAGIRLGAVLVPSSTELSPHDLAERMARVDAAAVICGAAQTAAVDSIGPRHRPGLLRIAVCGEGSPPSGWLDARDRAGARGDFERTSWTRADELLFLYFTSGTTSRPKIVAHTHTSYPVGHLSGMYWNGLRPADRHLNVSAPGWAKHAWSSLFAPCAAEATIVALAAPAPAPGLVLRTLAEQRVDSFCAPPTVWRRLVLEDLERHPVAVREATSAGEPLAAEIIATVKRAWNVRVRDGYGQTETTAQVGVTPGSEAPPGSMGRALPGYPIALLDTDSGLPGRHGEIAVRAARRPVGLAAGYLDDGGRAIAPECDGWYRTGDLARADDDGFLYYLGRRDDVFKCGGHRVSPLEVERAVLSHPYVAEAAVTPFPDPTLTAVPKAFVRLVPRAPTDAATALDILRHAGELLAPHCAPRRIEFGELPATSTGKVRRAELRRRDADRDPAAVVDGEFVTSGVETAAEAHLSLSTNGSTR
jgi:acetyl-CoA synthetase